MQTVYYMPMDQLAILRVEKRLSWDMETEHYHNAYECYYLMEGDRCFSIGNQSLELMRGGILIIPPFQTHIAKAAASQTISRELLSFREIHLSEVLTEKESSFLLNQLRKPCFISLSIEDQAFMENCILLLREYLSVKRPVGRKLAVYTVVQILDRLKKLPASSYTYYESAEANIRSDMLSALSFIGENRANPDISMKDVADHVHMSQSRFCELFKRTTGVSCMKYLNNIRMMQVENELACSEKPLKNIAEDNGFSSVAQMNRNYYAHFGVTPTCFRKQVREELGMK